MGLLEGDRMLQTLPEVLEQRSVIRAAGGEFLPLRIQEIVDLLDRLPIIRAFSCSSDNTLTFA
jgi:hypothetical protein